MSNSNSYKIAKYQTPMWFAPILAILVQVVFYFVNHPAPMLSDEAAYIEIANGLLIHGLPSSTHTFFDRYVTIFSLAGLIKFFGFSRYAVHLGNLVLLVVSIPLIFKLLKKLEVKAPEAVLLIFTFHPSVFVYLKDCRPDFYFTIFATFTILLLALFLKAKELKHYILFATALFLAFLTKESVIIIILSSVITLGAYFKRIFSIKLLIANVFMLLLCFGIYHLMAQAFDTNLFERLAHTKTGIADEVSKSINGNSNFFSERFGMQLFMFLFANREMQFLAIGIVPALYYLKNGSQNELITVSSIALITSLFYLVFGSVSLSSYIPLKLSARFWLFVLMPVSILYVNFISDKRKIALLTILTGLFIHILINRYLHLYFAIGVCFLAFWLVKSKMLSPIVFSLLLISFSVYRTTALPNSRNSESQILKEQVVKHKINTLFVDERVKHWDYIFFENELPEIELKPWVHEQKEGYYWISKNRGMMQLDISNQKADTLYYDGVNVLLKF